MTWSFSFLARDKSHAKEIVDKLYAKHHIPEPIYRYLWVAIDGVQTDGPIEGEGSGRLCLGANYTQQTSASLTLKPKQFSP